MPPRPRTLRASMTREHRLQLLLGFGISNPGQAYLEAYEGNTTNPIYDRDAMVHDFRRHEVDLMAEWFQDHSHHCKRPFAWWMSRDMAPGSGFYVECMKLLELGELHAEELAAARSYENRVVTYYGMKLRRPAWWWGLEAAELRDWGVDEGVQLVLLGALTPLETEFQTEPVTPYRWNELRGSHLTRDEIRALNPAYVPYWDAWQRGDWRFQQTGKEAS